jgi:hypothetical protein
MSDRTRKEESFLGLGWAFPPSFSAGGGDVEMVSGPEDIEQSLRILLGTAPGERVMHEGFGCDLPRLMFEELDQALLNNAKRLISDAIIEHEPRIRLDQVDVTRSRAEVGAIVVSVFYTVRGTNSRFNMVFPFYLMEATRPGA